MRETRTLEYKESISNSFLKTVSAFANYGTGQIKFGVDDQGKVVGIGDLKAIRLDIENKINDSIKPRPSFSLEVDDKTNVVTLTVVEGVDKPYFYKSKAYKRNDTATIEIDTYELRQLILEGQNKSFESLKAENQSLSFEMLAERMKARLGVSEFNEDILITLELYRKKDGYNRAAELLADENNFYGIDMARFGENINIILDREFFEKTSILRQFEGALRLFRKYYQYEVIQGAMRLKMERIPEEAFREALANAIVHRNWDMSAHIRIAMYEDYLEVISPGGLPNGLTEEEYLNGQMSVLRNPIIGNVFLRLQHIERFGTGVKRINKAYVSSRVKPRFEVYQNSVKVMLPVLKAELDLGADEKAVYDLFIPNAEISSSYVVKKTGFGKTKVTKLLKSLVEEGYIKITGNGRSTRYCL